MKNDFELQEGEFLGSESTKLFYWFAKKETAEQTLILLHGHGEHSGRYRKFLDHLSDLPLNLAAYDVRGHGRSEGERVFVNRFEDYINDFGQFLKHLQSTHQVKTPVILLGHSNGGLVLTHWSLMNQSLVKGLIVSSPLIGLSLPGFLKSLNRAIHALSPKFIYRRSIYPGDLTHSQAEIDLYLKDSFLKRQITSRLLCEMLKSMDQLEAEEKLCFQFPFFVLASGDEKIVDLEATKRFYEKVEAPAKDMTIFEGFYHEIFNEEGQEEVFEKLRKHLESLITI